MAFDIAVALLSALVVTVFNSLVWSPVLRRRNEEQWIPRLRAGTFCSGLLVAFGLLLYIRS